MDGIHSCSQTDSIVFASKAKYNQTPTAWGRLERGTGRLDYRTRSNSLITSQSWRNRKTKVARIPALLPLILARWKNLHKLQSDETCNQCKRLRPMNSCIRSE